MKTITQIRIILFLITLLLAFGCKDSQPPPLTSSVTPTKTQLEKSNFVKIISQLVGLPESQRKTFMQSFLANRPNSPIIEDSSIAIFYWCGRADTVLISGDIQSGWVVPDTMKDISLGDESFFYKIYSLPVDARIDYQYIVDGKTITDPHNPITTQSGYGLHSQCAMPLFKTKSVLVYRAGIEHGTVDSIFFKSELTSMKPRMLKIYKPAGYDSLFSLPALYVNDGFKTIEYCNYINVLDNLIAENKIKPFIAIFIDFVEGDQDYFINGTDEYFSFICKELVPKIDSNYKTSKRPEDRVISGISAGGHIALLTALKNQDVFLNAAGQSSTITQTLIDAVEVGNKYNRKLRFYFDVGRFDLISGTLDKQTFLLANQLLHKKMTTLGINHTFNVLNDGHQWANWRERVDEILIYFFGI